MSPVIGYQEISFHGTNRTMSVWYPVDPAVPGNDSPNPWDVFSISQAPIATAEQKKPVIVLSHGNQGNPHQLSWLIKEFVQHGYLVLGMEHVDILGGRVQINHWTRAEDVSQMIDHLAASHFAAYADFSKIGMAGFSRGGIAAVLVAGGRATKLDKLVPGKESVEDPAEFALVGEAAGDLDRFKMAQDWRDARIKAALLLSPAWGWIFDAKDLSSISIPVHIVAPACDGLLVTENNAGHFARSILHATYRKIEGAAKHCIFLSRPFVSRRQEIPEFLHCLFTDAPSVNRDEIQTEAAQEAVQFFERSLI